MRKNRLLFFGLFGLFVLAVTLAACSHSPTSPAVKDPPAISFFSVTPDSGLYGADFSAVLLWSITGASYATIDQGVGTVSPTSGELSVKPTGTTTWTLSAVNDDGTVTKKCVFTVEGRAVMALATYELGWTASYNLKVTGTARNDGNETGWNTKITFEALNNNNTILDTASGFPANLGDIAPGQSAVFEADFFNITPANIGQVDHITYSIEWSSRASGGTTIRATGPVSVKIKG